MLKKMPLVLVLAIMMLSVASCFLFDGAVTDTPQPEPQAAPRYDYLIAMPNSDGSLTVRAHPEKILSISRLVIPASINGSAVTEIDSGGFTGLANITALVLPDSLKKINSSAFANCTGLASVQWGRGLREIGNAAFSACTALVSINISSSVEKIGSTAFAGCSGLLSLTFDSGANLEIGDKAFRGISASSLTIPARVTKISSGAFEYNRKLTEITVTGSLPPELGSNVFLDTGIKKVYIPADAYMAYKTARGWSSYERMLIPR